MSPVPPDYDDDPRRWASSDRSTQRFGDVHAPVARIQAEQIFPVLDVGGGDVELGRHMGATTQVVVDTSLTQLRVAPSPKVLADAANLRVRDASVSAVTMLWMLYHLVDPVDAITEARRVLRRNGLFVASTASRFSDPELIDAYPPTPFDAEEAAEIVGAVFPIVEVQLGTRR
jgi:ubiquinone/menaquinone biosynthesis C-methylase UbiE